MDYLNKELEYLKKQGLYRKLKVIKSTTGRKVNILQKEFINFASNDYLGLTQHPKVKEAAKRAIEKYGTGSTASRLLAGSFDIHQQLEKKIAEFKGTQSALVFSSGYAANLGIISSILNKDDVIIIDKLNHASIIDGCRLSKAKLQVYPHNDMFTLERILIKSKHYRKRLIITETIFSMDGDLALLPEIVNLAKKHNALIMIDEAHATGVLGKNGRGAVEYFGLGCTDIDIQMGTFSKALGSMGGFVSGDKCLIEYLKNKARSFIYSTSLAPAVIAASLSAIEVIQTEPSLREKLLENTTYLRAKLNELGYDTMKSQTQIIPILVGDSKQTVKISGSLYEKGLFIPGIRPPTVPKNKARLRINLMAIHSKQDLDLVIEALKPFQSYITPVL